MGIVGSVMSRVAGGIVDQVFPGLVNELADACSSSGGGLSAWMAEIRCTNARGEVIGRNHTVYKTPALRDHLNKMRSSFQRLDYIIQDEKRSCLGSYSYSVEAFIKRFLDNGYYCRYASGPPDGVGLTKDDLIFLTKYPYDGKHKEIDGRNYFGLTEKLIEMGTRFFENLARSAPNAWELSYRPHEISPEVLEKYLMFSGELVQLPKYGSHPWTNSVYDNFRNLANKVIAHAKIEEAREVRTRESSLS